MNIINEKIVEYLNGLYKPLSTELSGLRKEGEENRIPIIVRDTEELILNFLRIRQPHRILEIGTAIGYSACCFATVCKDCPITTIEYNPEMKEIAERNIKRLGFDNQIRVLEGDAVEVMKGMNRDELFDFVFIDAGKSHYMDFFEEARRLCTENALIISDNVLLKGKTVSDEYDPHGKHKTNVRKMREFINHITKLENAHTSIIPVGDGLAISIIGDQHE